MYNILCTNLRFTIHYLYAACVDSALEAGPAVPVIRLGPVAQNQLDRGHVLFGESPDLDIHINIVYDKLDRILCRE